MTIDEFSSLKNVQFSNIIVNSCELNINLKLVKIDRKADAVKIIHIVRNKLKEFDLDFKNDIEVLIGDGAAVMVKVCLNCNLVHHLCYNHGIHFSIRDVLYIKRNLDTENSVSSEDVETNVSERRI